MSSGAWGIYANKKAALNNKDEAVLHQIGDSKDILSVLSMSLFSAQLSPLTSVSLAVKANIDAPEQDRLSEEEIVGQIS